MQQLFRKDYPNKRAQLLLRAEEFQQLLTNTKEFCFFTTSNHLQRRFVYAPTQENVEQLPWDLTLSYLLYAKNCGCLAVLYPHHTASQLATRSCRLVGVPLGPDGGINATEFNQSLHGQLLSNVLNTSPQAYLAGVYSSQSQSFVFPFPISECREVDSEKKSMPLPDGDGLCAVWMPVYVYNMDSWANLPTAQGKSLPPFYAWPATDEISAYLIRDEDTLSQAVEAFLQREKYQERLREIKATLQQYEQQNTREEGQGASQQSLLKQVLLMLDEVFSPPRETLATNHFYMEHLQQVAKNYAALQRRWQNIDSREKPSSQVEARLSEISKLIEKAFKERMLEYRINLPSGTWVIYPTKSFQLLNEGHVAIEGPIKRADRGEAEASNYRAITHCRKAGQRLYFDSLLLMRSVLNRCEREVLFPTKNAEALGGGIGGRLCLYIPGSSLKELWEEELPKLPKEMQSKEEGGNFTGLRTLTEMPVKSPPSRRCGRSNPSSASPKEATKDLEKSFLLKDGEAPLSTAGWSPPPQKKSRGEERAQIGKLPIYASAKPGAGRSNNPNATRKQSSSAALTIRRRATLPSALGKWDRNTLTL